jgi:Fe2+ transport system protein B
MIESAASMGGEQGLTKALSAQVTIPQLLSFLTFNFFLFPCMNAVAAFGKSSKSWLWTFRLCLIYFAIALLFATIVYYFSGLFP